MTGGLVARSCRRKLKAATRELAHRLAQKRAGSTGRHQGADPSRPCDPVERQLDAERAAIIDCMHTEEFRVAVKKFTSKKAT